MVRMSLWGAIVAGAAGCGLYTFIVHFSMKNDIEAIQKQLNALETKTAQVHEIVTEPASTWKGE